MEDLLKVTDCIEKVKWSEFVFQTPEMAEVYKRTKNYEPVSLAVVDEKR